MDQMRFRINDEAVGSRVAPMPHLLITALTSGTAQTLWTVRSEVIAEVKQLAVANVTSSSATLSFHSVPGAGSIGNGNAEMIAVPIPGNTTADLTPYIGQLYEADTTLEVYAGTASALVIHGWIEEIL